MAPHHPLHVSAGDNPLTKFGGMHITEFVEPKPGRAFCLRQRYRHDLPPELENQDSGARLLAALNHPSGPPTHFHLFQDEWYQVESGRMCVEINGVLKTITPDDGEVFGPKGSVHRFFIAPDSTEDLVVIVSAADEASPYQLDRVFFENWYGIWHDSLVHHDGKMDFIQLLCTFDGGDCYIPGPSWLPRTLQTFTGYWAAVIVGRWLGGLLGYKPFFKEYTTDWELAAAKMQSSWFTRRLVDTPVKNTVSMSEREWRMPGWQQNGQSAHMLRRVNDNRAGKERSSHMYSGGIA